MSHRRLSRSQRDTGFAEMRPNGRSQSVNVERSASVVALGNSRRLKVSVQDLHQLVGDHEQGFIGREFRFAVSLTHSKSRGKSVGQPLAKISREVGSQRNRVAFSVRY